MPTKEKLGECPYHGACIVFKDGDNKWINFNIDENSNQKLKNDNLIQVSDIGNWTYKLPKTKYNTIDTKLKDLLVED